MKLRQTVLATAFAGLTGFASAAVAAPPANIGPILDPVSKSYFELRVDNSAGGKKARWDTAHVRAASAYHEGRRGRLAVIKDQRTMEFIRQNFKFKVETWIGLRFFCQFRKLIWVTGELHPLRERGLWHRQWYRNSRQRCVSQTSEPYMPVYLTEAASGPATWQATGSAKHFPYYLVEYPAPAAPMKKSAEKAER